jgi:phosphonoacetate hydrolase
MPGIAMALTKEEVCARFDLPADREGDVAVIGDIGTVIGAAAAEHDLSSLADARLRSHGSTTEARVPFILSRPVSADFSARAAHGLRSHQIFEYAINGVV